jgi:small subunit ribosomal protein S20
MAHSLSAKKRVRQNAKRRLHNRSHKASLKSQVKRLHKAVEPKTAVEAKAEAKAAAAEGRTVESMKLDPAKEYKATQKKLDRLSAKGVLHPNTAARRKSRLALRMNKLAKAGTAPAAAK